MQRLHRATLVMGLLSAIAGSIFPLIILMVSPVGWVLVIGLAVGAAFSTVSSIVRYRTFTYHIDDNELFIQEGGFEKSSRTIPFHRIQNVRLEQNLPCRLLKVATVQVETAGSSGPEAQLSVIGIEEARKMQQLAALHQGSDSDHGAAADRKEAGHLLRAVPLRELIAAGLTSQFATVLLGVFGLLPLVFPQFDFIGELPDPLEYLEWGLERIDFEPTGIVEAVLKERVTKTLLFILGGLIIALLGYVFLWFGFRLSIHRDLLNWDYGLFTRRTGSLPLHRLQLLKIEEPLLRRICKLATVKVDTASDQQTAQEDKTGRGMLLPIVSASAMKPIVRRLVPSNRELLWRRVSPHAVRRGTIRATLYLLLFVPFLISPLGWQVLWGLLLIPAFYLLNRLAYRHTGFSCDPHVLAYRRGWLNRTTHLLPLKHVQSATVQQTPFDRRLGLASVVVDAAGQTHTGGMPVIRHLPLDEARDLVKSLLEPRHGRRRD